MVCVVDVIRFPPIASSGPETRASTRFILPKTRMSQERKRPATGPLGSQHNADTAVRPRSPAPNEEPPVFVGKCDCVSDRYEKVCSIGKGTYGVVYKAKDVTNGEIVTLKRFVPQTATASDGFAVTTLREIENLRLCASCPYTVTLKSVAVSTSSLFLVLEYCEHCLADVIDDHYHQFNKSPFEEGAVKTLMKHLLEALCFLHSHHLLHRDLKMNNLLYTKGGRLKLADFGLSRHYGSSQQAPLTPTVVSLWYRPPEILAGCSAYTFAIDVWAAGCVFSEFLTGFPPLKGKSEFEQIHLIFQKIGLPDPFVRKSFPFVRSGAIKLPGGPIRKFALLDSMPSISAAGSQLLTSLLQWNPAIRWTADQALRSPYFSEAPHPCPDSQMPQFEET